MKKIRVNVTQKNIERGVKGSECLCPVALALKRTCKKPVWVGRTYISIEGFRILYSDLSRVGEFVNDFDCGEPVKPFSFTLEVPE